MTPTRRHRAWHSWLVLSRWVLEVVVLPAKPSDRPETPYRGPVSWPETATPRVAVRGRALQAASAEVADASVRPAGVVRPRLATLPLPRIGASARPRSGARASRVWEALLVSQPAGDASSALVRDAYARRSVSSRVAATSSRLLCGDATVGQLEHVFRRTRASIPASTATPACNAARLIPGQPSSESH
jgi:hypothetical protein